MPEPDDEDLLVPGHPADAPPGGDPAESPVARAIAEDAEHAHPGRPLSRRSPFVLGFAGTLGLLLAYALAMLVVATREELLLVAVSLFLAIGLNPGVEWLMRRGFPRPLGVVGVLLGVIGFLAAFTAAVVPPLAKQVAGFTTSYPRYLDELAANRTVAAIDRQLHVLSAARAQAHDGRLGHELLGGALGATEAALSATVSTLTVLVLTVYFLSALPRLKRGAYRLVPQTRRDRVALLADEALLRIGGYVGSAVAVAVVAGTCALVAFALLGLGNPLALALVLLVVDVVPLLGAVLGGIPAVVVGFLSSTPTGLATLAYVVAYQQLENLVVYPRLMRRSVLVPPVVTIVAVLVGASLLGILGALLAIPLTAAVLLLVEQVVVPRQELR